MISLQVVPDRFTDREKHQFSVSKGGQVASEPHIRRPTRGIVLKKETFASIRVVVGSTGETVNLVDAGSNRGPSKGEFYEINGMRATDVYSNFFLQGIQEERQEKQQVLETFGESFIFLFGERARVLTFSGVLLNTFDFNWEAEWWHNYDQYLRGTRCVENDARVFISFDETLVSGYILGSSAAKDTNNPNHVNFQFQLFVTSYANFSNLGNPSAADHETNTRIDASGNFELDLATTALFRPNIIDPNDNESLKALGREIAFQDGRAGTPNLVEGLLRTGPSLVLRSFKAAQGLANRGLKALSNLAAGEVIRVPIGFEGSLAFDDENTETSEVLGGGVIRYTTFSDNLDEYVGVGSHYGSSVSEEGVVDFRLQPTLDQEKDSITQTINRARQIWREAGLDVPAFQLGPVSAFIAASGVGLLAAGATSAWRTQNPMNGTTPRIRGP